MMATGTIIFYGPLPISMSSSALLPRLHSNFPPAPYPGGDHFDFPHQILILSRGKPPAGPPMINFFPGTTSYASQWPRRVQT